MTQPPLITRRASWACLLVVSVSAGVYLAWADPGVAGTLGVLAFGIVAGVSLLMLTRLRPGRRSRASQLPNVKVPGGVHYPDAPIPTARRSKVRVPDDRGDRI